MNATDGVNLAVNFGVLLMFIYAIYYDLKSNEHLSYGFKWRCQRAFVWVIMGLNYSFQVSTRYSLTVFNTNQGREQINMSLDMFGYMTTAGLWVYAFAMQFNGFLIDTYGGRIVYLVGMIVHTIVNISFGIYCNYYFSISSSLPDSSLPVIFIYFSLVNYLQYEFILLKFLL